MRLGSDSALLQLATLTLRETAPDPETLVVHERILEAVVADVAGQADLLGLPGGTTLLREKGLRVGLGAQRALLPTHLFRIPVEEKELSHGTPLSTLTWVRIPRTPCALPPSGEG